MAFLLAQKYIDYICIAFRGYRGESSGGQDFIEHRPSEAAFAALSFYRNSSFGFRRIWLSFFDQRRNREENEAKIDGLMPILRQNLYLYRVRGVTPAKVCAHKTSQRPYTAG